MNKQITRQRIDEAKETGERILIVHPFPNRADRRAKKGIPHATNVVVKAHKNNRSNNKARKNNKLFLKLAQYTLSVAAKMNRR